MQKQKTPPVPLFKPTNLLCMTRRHYVFLYMVTGAFLFLAVSCRHQVDPLYNDGNGNGNSGGSGSSTTPCDPDKIYFQQQVLPILLSNCAMSGCHDEITHEEGVVLTSYEKVVTTTEIRPGNAAESELYKLIIDLDSGDRMPPPPQSALNQQQVQLIYQWIQQGAQNLICQSMCDSNSFSYGGAIRPLIANKCQGCHTTANAQGGVNLSTYAALKLKITDGRLWGSINHLAGFYPMPKNGAKLSDCEITQVKKWIEAGAPEN